ncbi:hypothetical protein A3K29_00640 [Candidatus Collierbacteria bacterium RIFOXYB2_FULL_46_14]|uniref:Bacterial Ig-like domain-containing protein n=1 Tax=Candidatus Collierbacteria bacterium GW2011_GWA2_46_26 TaxID=1618381 RepID=A0A0G1PKM0_9BACT|nr:MAG: hypothetical protein UW29_C0008G0024 [Candidatus Collierbacteria bacterium GW2011_GWC2_44_13]KKU33222.1 MAG: hypothetical protein UX47_C0005G0024 [Candidatus Collierbacteria bacterium GW2011_GWA2_46_26]OGD72644.1 MAG: hypothetical protein A3K29_00640 [Candidatus Collierbacteria bacterium RIFOXYB2_FULL_46_14]OGD75686.1 MAG: hypothetical protein A3K43_00640 [Candidatus Collierbacteria bacterium RIFOXYA2_FULL_46_20]OGD77022.1 MAG: hypothetical protein A3K39_00640 [Candidatus Collierbacteri
MKKILYAFWGIVLFFSIGVVFAQDLSLTRVGVLSTVGVDYANISYTGAIPVMEGTASPSSIVNIKIKTSTDATLAASPSGNWSFTPGVLDPGISTIVISSGLQSITFNLNFNATPAATPTATPTSTPTELPAAGVWEYYLPIIGAGLVIFFFGKFLKNQMLFWEGKKKI